MPAPRNIFKERLLAGETLYGCWLSLGEALPAEIIGTCGFDWALIDGEHAPNDIRSIRDQLVALEASPTPALARVPIGEAWLIKQVLDAGVQSVLVPMVESAEQAREMVRACRYPPAGNRGVGAGSARASRFSTYTDYEATADDQICLMVQIESRAAIEALDEILQVDGVDCVFIGPADLSSDYGYAGDSTGPEMHALILETLGRIAAAGKAPGMLCLDDRVVEYVEAGARMIASAVDVQLLRTAATEWAQRFRTKPG